jgi:chemotaxis protein methyltransferase CheR
MLQAEPQKKSANGRKEVRKTLPLASPFEPVPRAITGREFHRFQELIYREAGIWLSPAKTPLLVGRLAKRLRQHGLKSFKDYYNLVVESPQERVQMLDAITTNETQFFREPQHFKLLETRIFSKWRAEAAAGRRGRHIRVWSAGCSTGQEPYSLAMIMLDHFPAQAGWEIEIVATDLSARVLDIAKSGIWPAEKAAEIPPEYLKAFMLKGFGEQAGKIKAAPEIGRLIQFLRVNLNESTYPFSGKFDLIFCRNVLIYFDQRSREQVVRRLADVLSPDGYFFVGHAESLHTLRAIFSSVIPTVYQLVRKPGQANHGRQ